MRLYFLKKRNKTISITLLCATLMFFPLPGTTIGTEKHNQLQPITYINNPWLKIIAPNGGEHWSNIQTIAWSWGGEVPILPVYFNIYYQKINENWQLIIQDYATEENNYLWNTREVSNGMYLILVELWLDVDLDGDGDSIYLKDISDNWFTIENTPDNNPPDVWITKPKNALYINDKEISPFFTPIIFGAIQIWPHACDNESGLQLLELYINNELKANYTSVPRSWLWKDSCFGKYVIKLTAYDNAGNNASFTKIAWKFF